MSITTLFLAVIASIVVWFFLQQRLLAKPWLEEGPIDDGGVALSLPTAKLGLRVFLAVVTVLFMLLIMAYESGWRLRTGAPRLSRVSCG